MEGTGVKPTKAPTLYLYTVDGKLAITNVDPDDIHMDEDPPTIFVSMDYTTKLPPDIESTLIRNVFTKVGITVITRD